MTRRQTQKRRQNTHKKASKLGKDYSKQVLIAKQCIKLNGNSELHIRALEDDGQKILDIRKYIADGERATYTGHGVAVRQDDMPEFFRKIDEVKQ